MDKRKIFIEGNNFYRRAYFGWQDQNAALKGIIMGYKNSADCLVDEALQRGEKGDIKTLDTYIFPIVFLYRHSIETSIKAIYYRAYGKLPEGNHDLVMLWDNTYDKVISLINKEKFLQEIKKYKKNFINHSFSGIDFEEIRDMLLEFNEFSDKKGDVFKYLMDKKGNLYFLDSKFVDYDNLKKAINYIYKVLDYLYDVVDDYLSS